MQKKSSSPDYKWVIPFLVVLILVMAGLLGWLLYWDRIVARFSGPASEPDTRENAALSDVQTPVPPAVPILPEEPEPGSDGTTVPGEIASDGDAASDGQPPAEGAETPDAPPQEPAQTETPEPVEPEPAAPALDYAAARVLPAGLTLSVRDFTVQAVGQVTTLRVTGGSGNYTWLSQDPSVADVDQEGRVTSVSNGTVNVIVTDGEMKDVCIVRVKAPSGEYRLNQSDFTLRMGDAPYQLKLSGGDGSGYPGLEWTSSNEAVATVDATGLVTPAGPGMTVITALWEGHSRQCFVHVSRD